MNNVYDGPGGVFYDPATDEIFVLTVSYWNMYGRPCLYDYECTGAIQEDITVDSLGDCIRLGDL